MIGNATVLKWVVLVGAAEALLTGVVTIISASLFCRLILGVELAVSGPALGPLAGMAMFATGLAGWPTPKEASRLRALTAYNVLATIYLAYLGAGGRYVGILLWPAVGLHAILSVLLVYAWIAQPAPNGGNADRADAMSRSLSN